MKTAKDGISIVSNDVLIATSFANKMNITLETKVPFNLTINSPLTGEKLGELKEKDGQLTFEGKADSSAKVFFNELSKISINSKQ